MGRTRLGLVERLEDRTVPVVWGNPWPDGLHLTLSFAPDGTQVGATSSDLFRALNAGSATSVWEREILRAFQTWAVQGNINIGLTADGGQAFGTAGRPQGDSRFGDVRIGSQALSPNVFAISAPFDITRGTWSGDVTLNSAVALGTNGSGQSDLSTVLLQEAGHVLGVDNNPDPSSAMFEQYRGVRTGLSASDVTRIQSLYGARGGDVYEGTDGNNAISRATLLRFGLEADGKIAASLEADVTTTQDIDVYKFKARRGGMTISLETSGLSLFTGRITVYDRAGRAIATSTATDPTNGNLTLQMPALTAGNDYFVGVQSATTDVFGIGGYRLTVRSVLGGSDVDLSDPGDQGDFRPVVNEQNSFGTALDLRKASDTDVVYAFAHTATLDSATDVDFYRVRSPRNIPGALNVSVWTTQNADLRPVVTVYDSRHNLIGAEVIANEGGTYSVQVRSPWQNEDYYFKVQGNGAGGYHLGANFNAAPVAMRTLIESQIDATAAQSGQITINRSQLFHISLSAGPGSLNAVLSMTILDSQGNVVKALTVRAGETVTDTMLLNAGTYTFVFRTTAPLGFKLKGERLTDPIGPEAIDPTLSPTSGTAPPPATTTVTKTTTTTTTTLPPLVGEEWYWSWTWSGALTMDSLTVPYWPV